MATFIKLENTATAPKNGWDTKALIVNLDLVERIHVEINGAVTVCFQTDELKLEGARAAAFLDAIVAYKVEYAEEKPEEIEEAA
jgi:hypothetical protein